MTDASRESDPKPDENTTEEAQPVCLRCGARGPVGDDGFCDGCEKAMEQACL
jgi:hypothetical protein